MFALKRELKLNNHQKTYFEGCAGFSRFVYNYGLALMKESWSFDVKASDSKRLDTIKKVLTNVTKKREDFAWTNKYPSRIYQNSFIALKKAFTNWRANRFGIPQFKKKRH